MSSHFCSILNQSSNCDWFCKLQTRPNATVEVEISEDMQLVHFDFNRWVEIFPFFLFYVCSTGHTKIRFESLADLLKTVIKFLQSFWLLHKCFNFVSLCLSMQYPFWTSRRQLRFEANATLWQTSNWWRGLHYSS